MNVPAEKRLYKPADGGAADSEEASSHSSWWTSVFHERQQQSTRDNNDNHDTPLISLQDLPEEVLYKITSHLDAPDLLRLRRVNTFWAALAARNAAGWQALVVRLWHDKGHVCPTARTLQQQASSAQGQGDVASSSLSFDNNERACLEAYKTSVQDAAERQYLLATEEFLYNPATQTGTIWSFRFKESAGADWTQLDPWYAGQRARQMIFLADGTCRPYHRNNDNRNDNQDNDQDNDQDNNINRPAQPQDDPMVTPMTWRFITRPMDLPTRPVGSYVRITVGNRDVPTYAVRRSPTGNWGFVMESCWGLFCSFDLPPRIPPTPPTVAALPTRSFETATIAGMRRRLRHLRRSSDGRTQWVQDEDEDSQHGSAASFRNHDAYQAQEDPWDYLRNDEHLLITNEIQWREAFLYNVGARILPEGEEATDDFDRAWGGLGV